MTRFASWTKTAPGAVTTTPRLVRAKSSTPIWSSTARTCCDSACWAMCIRAAARVKLRASATATT